MPSTLNERTPETATIHWDSFGVPHLSGPNVESLFFAFGWAQMESHRSLLLRLYGKARGRGAEYWGEAYFESDRWMRIMNVPNRARAWARRQSPQFRALLQAFVNGINAWAEQHRGSIAADLAAVLPVKVSDVLAHAQAVIHFSFLAGPDLFRRGQAELERMGSNAWAVSAAIAPQGALLLGNPHLFWRDSNLLYEVHLCRPVHFYGASLVGFPVPMMGFNRSLGWTHTMNATGGVNFYELHLRGGGYRLDGRTVPLESTVQEIAVRGPRGGMRRHKLKVQHSVHGPVIAANGATAIALRVPGLDCAGICEQWWAMAVSRNLNEFENALRRMQLPLFNVLYADRRGHILHVFGGHIPVRTKDVPRGAEPLAGDTRHTLPQRNHAYEELPRVVDPASGWLQNSNDTPWTDTYPRALHRDRFPSYFPDAVPSFRAQHALRIVERPARTLNDLVEHKQSRRSELAARIVPDVVRIARQSGGELRKAAGVLERWDQETTAGSRGAVLFWEFIQQAFRQSKRFLPFAEPWNATQPFSTPRGISDPRPVIRALKKASRKVLADHGPLDCPWGDVYRVRLDSADLPAEGGPGGLGTLRVLEFLPDADGKLRVVAGDCFVFAVQFAAGGPEARLILAYGNSSEPGSPHRTDQLADFCAGRWREPLLSTVRITRDAARRERLLT